MVSCLICLDKFKTFKRCISDIMAMKLQRNTNVYGLLEDDLRKSICGGKVDYSKPIVGELELAKRYRISRESVRRAITKLVEEGYLERKQGKGTFVVEPASRKDCGAEILFSFMVMEPFINKIFDDYKDEFLEGIDSYCRLNNFSVEYAEHRIDTEKIIRMYRAGKIHGVIWDYPNCTYYENVRRVAAASVPTVTAGHLIPGIPCISVDFEDELVSSFDLLRTLGHERIGFINAISSELPYEERKNAYFKLAGEWSLYRAISHDGNEDILKRDILEKKPTALIVGGHALLAQALDAVKSSGLRLREDISLICLNDCYMAEHNIPSVTVYSGTRQKIGVKCVETLRLMASGGRPEREHLKIKGKLIWRRSCGPVKD